MQDIPDDQGLENIEFEVTIAASNSDSDVVTHDLSADHSDGFTLGGVDFAGHDG